MKQILVVESLESWVGRVVDPKNPPFRYHTTKATMLEGLYGIHLRNWKSLHHPNIYKTILPVCSQSGIQTTSPKKYCTWVPKRYWFRFYWYYITKHDKELMHCRYYNTMLRNLAKTYLCPVGVVGNFTAGLRRFFFLLKDWRKQPKHLMFDCRKTIHFLRVALTRHILQNCFLGFIRS